jgi:hypothetical protein
VAFWLERLFVDRVGGWIGLANGLGVLVVVSVRDDKGDRR